MTEKKKKGWMLPIIIIIIVIIIAAVFFMLRPKTAPLPQLEKNLESLEALAAENMMSVRPLVADACSKAFNTEIVGEVEQHFRKATAQVKINYLDAAALTEGLLPEIQTLLAGYVTEADSPKEIYNEDKSFRIDILEQAYDKAVEARLASPESYCRNAMVPVLLRYSDGGWLLDNEEDILDYSLGLREAQSFEESVAKVEYIDFVYRLPDWTSPGPKANPACYGQSHDPAEILTLLESETAKKLINGQELDFSADRDFIPGTPIRYYLDESLLTIVWQENEHGAVATFAETFIGDASQLRRKLADDNFGGQTYYYPTEFAAQTNAVLACSGDFYDLPARVYGLYVYNGKLMRSCLTAGQSCMFTNEGDMLFTYENQFSTEEEAQNFIDDNNIMFSLSFGPVMVDNGVDVTPYDYPIGEVRDTYARCAIGQLGQRHYLSMTINCQSPDYYVYVTLRQAADSMIAHGCHNAYTLDGGQTGSIVLGGELINPVQFGFERAQSDCFYFATAVPNE